MNPNTLAETLKGEEHKTAYGKQIRARLRAWFPRTTEAKNTGWELTEVQEAAILAWHNAKQEGTSFDAEVFIKEYKPAKAK